MNFIFIIAIIFTISMIVSVYFYKKRSYYKSNNFITTPEEALAVLLQGNKQFSSTWCQKTKKARKATSIIQKPFAVILNCSDSRVPTEIIFNQLHVGSVFVVRNAGNVIDGVVLGSIEYGIEQLHAVLVIILGHERCGAVIATVDSVMKQKAPQAGHIKNIIEAITPAVDKILREQKISLPNNHIDEQTLVSQVVKENVLLEMSNLYQHSKIVRDAVDAGKIKIVGAYYDLDDGNIHIIS